MRARLSDSIKMVDEVDEQHGHFQGLTSPLCLSAKPSLTLLRPAVDLGLSSSPSCYTVQSLHISLSTSGPPAIWASQKFSGSARNVTTPTHPYPPAADEMEITSKIRRIYPRIR